MKLSSDQLYKIKTIMFDELIRLRREKPKFAIEYYIYEVMNRLYKTDV